MMENSGGRANWDASGDARPMEAVTASIEVEDVPIQLVRPIGLDHHIDRAALLSGASAPEPPYWMHLWPGALALARMLAGAGGLVSGMRVLELGCGLGLPALVAARRGARVVASDRLGAPLDFLRHSARLNGCRIEIVRMDWAMSAVRGAFEVCLGADIAYDTASEDALVQALTPHVASGGRIWLADSVNTARESLAGRLRAAGLGVETREVREWEDNRPVWVRVIEAWRR